MISSAIDALKKNLPHHCVSTDLAQRLALCRDASLYRLVPEVVVRPITSHHVATVLSVANTHNVGVTFRAAGTSLSGQAVGEAILVDISRGWDGFSYDQHSQSVTCGPGITGGRVNALLSKHGRKIGPDPASINAAMIGGIVANNASGMCCGTEHNSYNTIASMKFLLPSGHHIDTSREQSNEMFREAAPKLFAEIGALREEIRANQSLREKIQHKYRIKNTMGYCLNAFIDYDREVDIFAHLLVGSEGTLGFIEEVSFRTIVQPREMFTQLFLYPTLDEACAEVAKWSEQGAAAVELMDDASIASFVNLPTTPKSFRHWHKGIAALLVEFHTTAPNGYEWVSSADERAQLWKLRKGLMPTVGAARAAGTTMINEDIAVPPARLPELVRDVQQAFGDYGYDDGIIFGHAKDGNIHFVVSQDFSKQGEVDRYDRFMQRIANIVVEKHHGSLKAEHGTGRNMAPFLELEWGREATELMWRIKRAADPNMVLNPDVLLSNNQRLHLENIKPVPAVNTTIDSCIECGFCEHGCPTRETSLTPRQRIALEREYELLEPHQKDSIAQSIQRQSLDTCAVDGVCAVACPVGIDTGEFVRSERAQRLQREQPLTSAVAALATRRWSMINVVARAASHVADTFGWPKQRLGTPTKQRSVSVNDAEIVFVPGCSSKWFGRRGTDDAAQRFVELCTALDVSLAVSNNNVCCGQPLASKGLLQQADELLVTSAENITQRWPNALVVTDVNTCAHQWSNSELRQRLLSPQTFIDQYIVGRFTSNKTITLHPGCGTITQRESDALVQSLAKIFAGVSVPASASCCGMAGSHGINNPEVVAGAVRQETQDIHREPTDYYVTLNPLCASALEAHTSVQWNSLWTVLLEAQRAGRKV